MSLTADSAWLAWLAEYDYKTAPDEWAQFFYLGFEAAAPRVVSTVAELDALELGSVILDRGGMSRQNSFSTDGRNFWEEPGNGESDISSSDLIAHVIKCGVEPVFDVLYSPVGDAQ